jgi:ankyrin repeat protein
MGKVVYEIPGMSVLQYALGSAHMRTYFPNARLNMPMLRFLLDNGAQITSNDIMNAAESCSMEALQLLVNHGGKLDRDTASRSLFQLVEVNLQLKTFETDTPLHEMLAFLLSQGADIDGVGWNLPLHAASSAGSLDLVKFLVANGANMTLTNDSEMTPLMLATLGGSLEVVQFLLESGAEVNQRVLDEDGIPLHNALTYTCYTENDDLEGYATDSNNPELVRLLLRYGANPVLEGEEAEPFSPLYLARENGLTEIVKILEDHIAASMLDEQCLPNNDREGEKP